MRFILNSIFYLQSVVYIIFPIGKGIFLNVGAWSEVKFHEDTMILKSQFNIIIMVKFYYNICGSLSIFIWCPAASLNVEMRNHHLKIMHIEVQTVSVLDWRSESIIVQLKMRVRPHGSCARAVLWCYMVNLIGCGLWLCTGWRLSEIYSQILSFQVEESRQQHLQNASNKCKLFFYYYFLKLVLEWLVLNKMLCELF